MLKIPLSDFNSETGLVHTISVLRAGGLVVFPSDTVYGLLVDANNPQAVQKLLAFKERPPGKAVSVFVTDISMIEDLCLVTAMQKRTLAKMLPGPYTIVLPSKHAVEPALESERGTLGVRIPFAQPVTRLMDVYGKPVTATSANLGGNSPHYSVDSFIKSLPKKKAEMIDLIVDAGKLPRNKPSTVVDLTGETVNVLRVGDLLLDNTQALLSRTEQETKDFAAALLNTFPATDKPIIMLLKGDLGAGKTVFTKGLAESFGINDVISPTFVVYYEYDVENNKHFQKLIHFDLYNIQEPEELEHLGIPDMLTPGNLLVIEWGEKIGDWFSQLRKQAEIMIVEIEHISPTQRKLTVHKDTK